MDDKTIGKKPKFITVGVTFLYVSILSILIDIIIASAYYYNKISKHPHINNGNNNIIIVLIIFVLIYLSILFFLTYKISKGKNWARVTFLIIFITIIITNIPSRFQNINIIGNCLQLIGFILLYCNSSNKWFQTQRTALKKTV